MKANASLVSCALVASLAGSLTGSAQAAPKAKSSGGGAKVEFNRDIRPILSDKCYACHGPDKNTRKAKLRLDLAESALAERDGSAAIVPGDPRKSELIRRIHSTNEDDVMPPPKHPKHLSPQEKQLLERWIAQGAKWEGHWAYIPPTRPPPPKVKAASWPRNPIDHFILARLETEKLKPSPPADRRTLIRRLSFDLTGLPPKSEEVAAFVADPNPKAYEDLVDRLLNSPHYGERMAVHWLDLVRFADTIGYHSDNPRNIHPYRDYVINAFNDNLPFNRFSTEQLAGDLLPNATLAQKVASGYNRLLQTTEEGGAQPKEYQAIYFADRVRNFSSVWLGTTMGCSQCHDHKFDPFTMKDFYSLAAFFADVNEAPTGRREEGMMVPDPAQAKEQAQLEARIAELKQRLNTPTAGLAAAQAAWEKTYSAAQYQDWQPLQLVGAKSSGETRLETQPDGSLLATGNGKAGDTYTVTFKAGLQHVTGVRLELLPDPSLPKSGPGRGADGNLALADFTLAVKGGAQGKAAAVELREPTASFAQRAKDDPVRVWQPASVAKDAKGKVSFTLAQPPQIGREHQLVFALKDKLAVDAGSVLTITLRHDPKSKSAATIGRFRVAVTDVKAPNAPTGLAPEDVAMIIAEAPAQRPEAHRSLLAAHYRGIAPLLEPVRQDLAASERRRMALLASIPRTLVSMQVQPVEMRIKPRGNWMDDAGELVVPAVPHSLNPPASKPERATRLDLARWLFAPENPLTARVFVNRLWKLYFGEGLARSLEDVGSQGEWPTHPELIDWLAVEFRESGWDVKHVLKLLLTSAAYRQTSVPGKLARERDPYNRLLGRQARFRLEAEFVRDNALAVSGLLMKEIGGASARPYQPEGYWQYLNFPKRTYPQDHGQSLYRRSLYTHWQRSFLHPSLLAFDAPSREECVAERARSNTPQQALVLLNDPIYVEAARVFAERIVRHGGTDERTRLDWAFARAVSRTPAPAEAAVLLTLYRHNLERYRQDTDAARKLASVGEWPAPKDLDPAEMAAWTAVARTLLNLHETVTRL